MRNDDLVVMGHIRGAFGIQGWVKIHADTEYADSLLHYPVWWLGKPSVGVVWTSWRIEDYALHPKALVVKFAQVLDRNAAEALCGYQVAVERSALPVLDNDEYYWSDLIGLNVINGAGEPLGTVVRLMETGGHDILVVHDGSVERLIPFVQSFIGDVDLVGKRIVVDWGLDF